MTDLQVNKSPINVDELSFARIFQRGFDLVVASLALAVFFPLMLMIAAAIYFESGRPIFFAHRRVGQLGRPFSIYKFRKFWSDCSADGLQLTLKNDTRFTRVGRILASTKLDELPQFLNVLQGDMSMVGPRPESLKYADCFAGEFAGILLYNPGIFGPSQVKFRHENALYPMEGNLDEFYRTTLFPSKARMDLAYYPHRTLLKDCGWICRGLIASMARPLI